MIFKGSIRNREDKLKFWGVIYKVSLIGSKIMLKWIKKLLSESAQKRKISTYQISVSSDCLYYDNELKSEILKPKSQKG